MDTVAYKKDARIYKAGERMHELGLIVKGSVRQVTKERVAILEAGNLLGLAGCSSCIYQADYYAETDVVIYGFPYRKTEDLDRILTEQKDYGSVFILAALKQAGQFVQEYRQIHNLAKCIYTLAIDSDRAYKYLCSKYALPEHEFSRISFLTPMEGRHSMPEWKVNYLEQFSTFTLDELKGLFTTKELCIGTIIQTGEGIEELLHYIDEIQMYVETNKTILLSPKKNDMFQLLFDLENRAALVGKGREEVHEYMDKLLRFLDASKAFEEAEVQQRITEYRDYDFASVSAKSDAASEEPALGSEGELSAASWGITGGDGTTGSGLGTSLVQILHFAEESEESIAEFKAKLEEYRDLSDPYSTEDDVRKLRKWLTSSYYRVYKNCVKRALTRGETTPVIEMFLNFGYMDAAFVGEENAVCLQELLSHLFLCHSEKVYTFFNWLRSIYMGEHEPSISELDMDYNAYLKDAVKSGAMSAADADKIKDDPWKKVEYELDNVFQSVGKITSGRITTFCPILNEMDMLSTPERMLLTANKIQDAIDKVRRIDFGLFYREVMFSDEAHGLQREYINKEILPDIILLPNAGSKGMMWQVTEGVRNNTSARIMLPIFTAADVEDMIIENCGRYRWEMCRKVQGSRWNDVTTPSLTSEYSDYIQYYKKNFELSTEAKEKIHNALTRARNNFREVFVKDYENWIKYEANGSFRLNKVAREILFTYCPFPADTRESLKENPMFKDILNKYQILTARKVKRLQTLYQRYEKSGGEITPELQENMDFYTM